MDEVNINVIKLVICVMLLFHVIKTESVSSLEEEIKVLRTELSAEIENMQATLKKVSQERENISNIISAACNSKEYFQNAKKGMRELMTSFANISIELNSINILKRETTDGEFALKDYKDSVQYIRSFHSDLDQLESDVWTLTFNRQINERKLQKSKKRLNSSSFKSKTHRLAEWGIHANIDIVIADSPSPLSTTKTFK